MEEQELKDIWKKSSNTDRITINSKQLINHFKNKMEDRERTVRRRDLREVIGAVIGIGGHIYIAITLPFSVPTLGALLVVLSLCYFIYKLRTHRKSKYMHDLFLPLKEQLQMQRKFMLNQAQLLDTVLYWGFLPFFISYMIFVWGSAYMSPYNNEAFDFILITKLKGKIIATILMAIYGVYIVRLNKRAAKVNWKPLINQIDDIIESLKKE